MNIDKIKNANTKILGKNVIYYDEISSTQDIIRNLAEKHVENGTIVIADNQVNGKGTKGRTWVAEKNKNITMSLIMYPNCKVEKLEGLTIEIARQIVKAIKELYGYKLKIKEPNDLMLNDKKICGILTQCTTLKETVCYVLIGIGFNVNQVEFNKELSDIATSLKKEFNIEFEREEIVAKILENLKVDYVHVLVDGRIVKTGTQELAKEIEKNGYGIYKK